eukprot:2353473-Alexandrium_andersonii.AAC.1
MHHGPTGFAVGANRYAAAAPRNPSKLRSAPKGLSSKIRAREGPLQAGTPAKSSRPIPQPCGGQ